MMSYINDDYDDKEENIEGTDGAEKELSEEDVAALLAAQLDLLGASIARKRDEAIIARAASGIEDEWTGDEEFYQGYDDANRHEFNRILSKPTVGQSTDGRAKKRRGSTVFPNITQPYVDAASARVGDMLLPTDDRNFALTHTPIPDMGADMSQQPAMQQIDGGVMIDQQAQQSQAASIDVPAMNKEAADKADKAQTRIDDWLSECQYHAEVRKVIDDCARIGTGVLKGPVPVNRRAQKWESANGDHALVIVDEIKPASFRVDAWNLYPDPSCGECIHDGDYIIERDVMTSRRLSSLKGLPGYIDSQIDICLNDGPLTHDAVQNRFNDYVVKKEQFEVWYYHGTIKSIELEAAGCECEDGKTEYPAMITMVNNRVIRASISPLDSGEFPYDVIPWKSRTGMPWGVGVARQMRTPQRMATAATRNLMDNAGLAGGPQIVVRRGVVPENGSWGLEPLKIWIETEDSGNQAGAPLLSVTIPMLQNELSAIIQLAQKFAEETTGMPMLMQGNQGRAPDTVGGMTILNNNANAVLRRVARLFDSKITEPHIRRYYEWLMSYGEKEDEKGDFQIIARGSSALIERDIQSQEMVQIVNMSLNPIFGLDPAKAIKEFLKSRRFDPESFSFTDEEVKQQAESQQGQQQPEDPRIVTAQIAAESAAQRDQLKAELEQMKMQLTAQEGQAERELKLMLAEMDQTGAKSISMDQLKARLADTAIKTRTQKELSAVGSSRSALTPPTEPVQQAPTGQAFQQ